MDAGGLARPEDMDRIEFLAKMRNLASAPMQQVGDYPASNLIIRIPWKMAAGCTHDLHGRMRLC